MSLLWKHAQLKKEWYLKTGKAGRNWHTLIFSKGHSETWVDVYVNELAEETYRNTAGPYLVCAKIVKASYDDEDGKEFRSLTVMVKMPDGYDPENGDW